MARTAATPPFPTTPGSWLAWFRYRCRSRLGEPLSPEQLGNLLGVSGATVRRWESGYSRPSHTDIACLGKSCGLSALEVEFLRTAFNAKEREQPPDSELFLSQARRLLAQDSPCLLLDSFYFIRGLNNHASVLFENVTPKIGDNLLPILLRSVSEGASERAAAERIERLLVEFWFSTAMLCGSKSYVKLLLELRREAGFEKLWCNLIQNGAVASPLAAPYRVRQPGVGSFRVFTSSLVLPPVYHLYEYVPIQDSAHPYESFRPARQTAVYLDSKFHWSLETEDGLLLPLGLNSTEPADAISQLSQKSA